MRIITVSGAHSQVGKTALIESLLKRLKEWSCLKVTVLHKGNCPVGKICQGCQELSSKFFIVHDKHILEEKGKDTQRFKKAGAKEVLWLRAKPEGLEQGLREAVSRFSAEGGSASGGKGSAGLIIEGTSVLKYLKPDLAIFVKKENSVLKPSAKAVLKKIDLTLTWKN